MKKRLLLTAISLSLLAMLCPVRVFAQSGIQVVNTSVQAGYPVKLDFKLSARSSANIVDIRMHYAVEAVSFAKVVSEAYVIFEPAPQVDVTWSWDMRRTGGLPPGATLNYWWTITDSTGASITTSPARVRFDDTRYNWKNVQAGSVTIFYYNGDSAFAGELMAAANDALNRLGKDTGTKLERPVSIYIYANSRDLQGALIFPQEWTGGVAYPAYATIALGISPANLAWGKGAIAHELAHMLTGQVTLNPYNDIPVWLDEGLAMYAEGPLQSDFANQLNQAIKQNNLISVMSLASPFSALPALATLSYAESFSIVSFLISTYGQSKMQQLLSTYREGASFDGALMKVYGFNMEGLDQLWRKSLNIPARTTAQRTRAFAWLNVFSGILAPAPELSR